MTVLEVVKIFPQSYLSYYSKPITKRQALKKKLEHVHLQLPQANIHRKMQLDLEQKISQKVPKLWIVS